MKTNNSKFTSFKLLLGVIISSIVFLVMFILTLSLTVLLNYIVNIIFGVLIGLSTVIWALFVIFALVLLIQKKWYTYAVLMGVGLVTLGILPIVASIFLMKPVRENNDELPTISEQEAWKFTPNTNLKEENVKVTTEEKEEKKNN
ncbi:hypothetical protein [Mycoplasmopsis adleri]|uniref:hypothetical protein n=1 Tax=Mycoplasmopsis adleri TaxID=51362 RepID=UPI003873260C